jgi:hypothetical protein
MPRVRMLGNIMEVDNPTRIILHIASGPMLIMEDWESDFTCYHCRPNWTGNGSGDVENKVVDLSF